MSTRSIIGMQREDVGILAIYCHNDGYPDGVGTVLHRYYQEPEKIAALMALGDISVLGPELGEKHDFDLSPWIGPGMEPNPAYHRAWTTAYHRDREEPWEDVAPGAFDLAEFLHFCEGEYHYLYYRATGWWLYGDGNQPRPLKYVVARLRMVTP